LAAAVSVSGDITMSNTGEAAIASGVIVNNDINASAGIVDTKLATISTAGKVAGSAVQLVENGGITNNSGLKLTGDSATAKINASGQIEGLKPKKENFTLVADDITAQYVDCAQIAAVQSMIVVVDGVFQIEGEDYTLSTVSSKTRITFAGDLATAGAAALIATDKLHVQYL
jgi:hypothetical protein